MSEVKVEILNQASGEELQSLISDRLNKGFRIQDSQVRWYQGRIEGVYVFVKYKADEQPKEKQDWMYC